MWRAKETIPAEALMREALDNWLRHQGGMSTTPPTEIERDVVELRNIVFRPHGDGVFVGTAWGLRSLSPSPTPFFVVDPDVYVKFSNGEIQKLSIRQPFPDYPNVLFLDADQLAFFDRLLAKIGGTARRKPTAIMEVPNQ